MRLIDGLARVRRDVGFVQLGEELAGNIIGSIQDAVGGLGMRGTGQEQREHGADERKAFHEISRDVRMLRDHRGHRAEARGTRAALRWRMLEYCSEMEG